jgi:hypothetical protein
MQSLKMAIGKVTDCAAAAAAAGGGGGFGLAVATSIAAAAAEERSVGKVSHGATAAAAKSITISAAGYCGATATAVLNMAVC